MNAARWSGMLQCRPFHVLRHATEPRAKVPAPKTTLSLPTERHHRVETRGIACRKKAKGDADQG